jgi:hypothetical protein
MMRATTSILDPSTTSECAGGHLHLAVAPNTLDVAPPSSSHKLSALARPPRRLPISSCHHQPRNQLVTTQGAARSWSPEQTVARRARMRCQTGSGEGSCRHSFGKSIWAKQTAWCDGHQCRAMRSWSRQLPRTWVGARRARGTRLQSPSPTRIFGDAMAACREKDEGGAMRDETVSPSSLILPQMGDRASLRAWYHTTRGA